MPNYRRRLVFLKTFVLISVVGSVFSFFSVSMGWGELYPFATWKLFTQPRGSKRTVSFYRIYTRTTGQEEFTRQRVRPTLSFTQDEYVYTLDFLVDEALTGNAQDSKKVKDYARYLYPEAKEYRVVRELYDLSYPKQKEALVDTATVLHFSAE